MNQCVRHLEIYMEHGGFVNYIYNIFRYMSTSLFPLLLFGSSAMKEMLYATQIYAYCSRRKYGVHTNRPLRGL
jgi:hypothetical protein